jgi:hypothetical protein
MSCSDVRSCLPHGSGETAATIPDRMARSVCCGKLYCLKLNLQTGEYIGCLLFENSAFCRKISEILREYCGKPIHEIGDIELSHAL